MEIARESLWWDTLPPELASATRPTLTGELAVDVAIVGAGYTGLWTAHYLLAHRPDLRVAILEAEVAGFGASGRNGGWCSALFPTSIDALARKHGRESARAMQDAMHDTVAQVGTALNSLGIDAHWQQSGTLVLARTPLQNKRAIAEIENWRSWGYGEADYAYLSAEEASERTGASQVLGATFTPHCAAIHPARLVRSLAQKVESAGATIYEQSRVTSISPGIVITEHGQVRAKQIVRATEGYTSALDPKALIPVYSLMLATEPLAEETLRQIGLSQRETFSDHRNLIIYGQRTRDGRIAFGGRGAPYHFASRIKPEFDQHKKVHANLKAVLADLFPALGDVRITHEWGGPLGIARDWMASVGYDPATGLAWAGGYVGDGVGTANLAGRTLADLLLGRQTTITRLPWVGHRSPNWEPEPLRWLSTNAGLAAMTVADRSEDRTGRPSRLAGFMRRFLGH